MVARRYASIVALAVGAALPLTAACLGQDPPATTDTGRTDAADDAAVGPAMDGSAKDGASTNEDVEGPSGFIVTPEVDVPASTDTTYCYYFRTPNDASVGIRKWHATLTGVIHDITVFTTKEDLKAPGTLTTTACGFEQSGAPPSWLFAADTAASDMVMPSDDGAGKPLGQPVEPSTAGFVVMHVVNGTGSTAKARAVIEAQALPSGTAYTKTASFFAYDADINIPAAATNTSATHGCTLPAGLKFWRLTTRTHKRATKAMVKDGATALVTSTDWEHPAVEVYSAPFKVFGGAFNTECIYDNPGPSPVTSGSDVMTDEQCVGVGMFFPASAPLRCVAGTVL